MAKDLYIHRVNKFGDYFVKKWEDVKVTRDKGYIVTKADATYKLKMGGNHVRDSLFLDKIYIYKYGYPESIIDMVEYISFDKEILTDDIIREMKSHFINQLDNDIKELEEKLSLIKEARAKFD